MAGTSVKRAVVGVAGLAMVMAGATPASAQNADANALAAVESVASDVVAGAARDSSFDDGSVAHAFEESSVSIPLDLSETVEVGAGDTTIHVTLPEGDGDASGKVVTPGIVEFDNADGSTILAVAREDASFQVLTVIADAGAPQRYDYGLSLPADGRLEQREDGAVFLLDAEDNFLGVVAPAWAKDANGAPVPTHYEIAGSTLTQVVEHHEGVAYPVTADPWLGIQLFTSFRRDTYNGDYRYSAWVTAAGAVVLSGGGGVGGYFAGRHVFNNNGWSEWKAKWPAITNKATLRQQYECHVAAGVYGLPFTKDYNLERSRTNRSNWGSGVINHRCNW